MLGVLLGASEWRKEKEYESQWVLFWTVMKPRVCSNLCDRELSPFTVRIKRVGLSEDVVAVQVKHRGDAMRWKIKHLWG